MNTDQALHIMLDLETLGTKPGSIVVSIGAVCFNREWLDHSFHVRIDPISSEKAGLTVDVDTVLWWMDQTLEAREEISRNAVPLPDALQSFSDFVAAVKSGSDHRDVWVWGNGVNFDNALLRAAYAAAGMEAPWEHWGDRCYRTMKQLFPEVPVPRMGTHHNAADDAMTQAAHLIDIWKRIYTTAKP